MNDELKGGGLSFIPQVHRSSLSLRELEALARALLPVLLALLDAGVARDQAGVLERGAQVCVELDQGACDAVANRAGLARGSAALDVDQDVEFAGRLRQLERLADDHPQRLVREILFESLLVDADIARAWAQVDTRRRA